MALLIAGCGDSATRTPAPTATPTASPAAAVDCRGAAARVGAGCEEPLTVEPAVEAAERDPAAPCERTEPLGLVAPCAFGEGPAFALIGDSHAGQLRSAFAVVAREQGWRGYAITRNSCSYVRDGRALPEPEFSQCVEFKQQVPQWLERHPEVSTVFVVGLTRDSGGDSFAAQVDGERAAWQRFPPSVKHIVVIRDTPELRPDTLACVQAAVAEQRPPGSSCAVPRATALPPDPAVAAAQASTPPLPTIDLTSFFCDAERCFPVIGGVLAYKDLTHVTPSFAATLGPFLLAEVRRVSAHW